MLSIKHVNLLHTLHCSKLPSHEAPIMITKSYRLFRTELCLLPAAVTAPGLSMVTHLGRGCRPHHLPIVQHQCTSHSLIFVVNVELPLVTGERPHRQQELGEVVAVQSARLGRKATWKICVADACHSLPHAHNGMSILCCLLKQLLQWVQPDSKSAGSATCTA